MSIIRERDVAHRAAMLLGLTVTLAAPLCAQRVITYDELAALSSTPPDHRIAYGPGPLQFGNLRLPDGPGRRPVVVFIHGGCWLSQYDIGHVAPLEQALADAGYAVWSLEYRRVGDDGGGWPGTFQDVALGADHVRALARAYPLDTTLVVAMGHSAGGQFALWLAGRPSIPATSELHAATPLTIHGVLGLAPAPDLEGLHAAGVCGNVIDSVMGGSPMAYPERYRAGSPMQMAPLPVPQVLVIGAHDQRWAPIGRAYHARATAAGDTLVRVIEAPASGHFDMVAPTTTTWPLVIEALRSLVTVTVPAGR